MGHRAEKSHRQPNRTRRPVAEELEPRLTPSLSYTLNLVNDTGLPAPTAANPSDVQILGYTNYNGGLYLTTAGTFQPFGSAASLTSFPLSALPNGNITLSGDLTSARIVVAYGAPFTLAIANLLVTGPSPNIAPFAGPNGEPYDIFEITLAQTGSNPGLFVNTSQVDQFGMPITVSGNGQSVGVTPGVTRSQIIQGFQSYVNAQPNGSAFAQLVMPATQPAPPNHLPYDNVRIEAPADVSTSPYPWATSLNGRLRHLFEAPPGWDSATGRSDLILQSSVLNGSNYVAYEGTPVQWQYAGTSSGVTYVNFRSIPTPTNPSPTANRVALPSLGSGYSYNYQASDENSWFNALMFTPTTTQSGEFAEPYFVFEPFWQANTTVAATSLSISGTVATITTNGDSGVVYPGPNGNSTVTIANSSDPSVLPDSMYTVTNVLGPMQFQISVTGGTTPASFSANVSLGDSFTPSWIASAHQAALTPGQMTFAGNGVFADQGATSAQGVYTPGQVQGTSAAQDTYQLILANLENQLVAALNRGVANIDYKTPTSPTLSITNVAFGTDSSNNPQAIFTTAQPITFAPSIGEFVTISGLPTVAGQNLNNTFSPTGALGLYQFTVALTPSAPISGSYPVISGAAQLAQDSSGSYPGQYLNSTWYWFDASHYYSSGVKDNLYARALHNMTVTPSTGPYAGQSVSPFINQQVYALSYDDQGGHSPSLFFGPSTSGIAIAVTLDPFSPLGSSPNAIYVEKVYGLLLSRAADHGAQAWVNLLNAGTNASDVVEDIERSTEYLNNVVEALYQHYLNRPADPGGLSAWTSALTQGQSIEQVTADILASPEYFNQQTSPSNASFVASLYQNVLGRSVSPAEMQGWVNALNGGASRGQVAMGFLTSPEYRAELVNAGGWVPYVPTTNWGGYYHEFLLRPADPTSLSGWVNALASGLSDQAVLAAIFGSPEGYHDWS
jgi:hypothetical protein